MDIDGIESFFSRDDHDADLRTTDRIGQVSRRYRSAIDGSEEFINQVNRRERERETNRDLSREIKRDRDNRR